MPGHVTIPEGFHFTKEHEWAEVKDSEVRIGISDYAQEQLGDVVFVELPEVGKKVKQAVGGGSKESELGTVESIKAVSSIYAPLSGEVKEVNEELEDKPEPVSTDPYGDGWICVIDPSNLDGELKNLMDSKAYEDFLEAEG